ncbi:PP2C family protein-serine/threonine phosphatase [Streptomyces sp. N50]|uniref:PP2C family protein-serine/threonine phosphatase n=1 Tax=Streptomyces sp. N50 TaxID=3081765 RepID=UPI00296256C8|nr:PP2C family protein-serine/threonine phosphatase [Streptomyces sp. N50]WOX11101.1 PP2C family protein-serine/threonine phosphatase [Streptomyces sp. N50]
MSGRGHRPVRYGALGRSPLDGDPEAIRRQHLLRVRGRSVAWIPPLLVLVSILLVDWYTGGEFRTVSWIVLVPGIAAAICGVRGTAVFAVLGLATYVLADHAWPRQYQTGLPDFILVGVGGALAVLACVVRVRGERRMLRMRDVAETTRRTLLRPLPPGWGGLDHAAVYLAADAFARVGGDFYDIQPGPHGTRALVGDVQGKGLGAVEAAAALLGTFREAGYHERELATVAARLETRIHRHGLHLAALDREDDDRIDRFATAILLSFPVAEPDTVEVVNFGHEPPLVVGPHGVRSLPPGHGLPLGLGELAHMDGPPPTLRVALGPGETLLVVTDGVTEARDGAGVFYPLKSLVSEGVLADPHLADPDRLVAYVRDGTLRHSGGHLADDTTIFAVRRS